MLHVLQNRFIIYWKDISEISLHCKGRNAKNWCVLDVLFELPNDESLGIETYYNTECHLLNWHWLMSFFVTWRWSISYLRQLLNNKCLIEFPSPVIKCKLIYACECVGSSRSGSFVIGWRVTGDYIMGRWMDTEAGLNTVAKRKDFVLTENRTTFANSAYSTCIDWAIPNHNSGSFIWLIIWTSVRVTH